MLVGLAVTVPAVSHATIVEFDTNFGTFQVNLYDVDTPETVANFLAYVQDGNYSDSVIHRSIAGFIIQGGALVTDSNAMLSEITTRAPVTNEPVFGNVRGTIAMAKLASDPNSATSQWFFNLSDNTANLDNQNGGFTVFGEVVGNGMIVVDAMAAVQTYNGVGGLNDFPLQNYTAPNNIVTANFLIINSVTVIDTTVNSAAGLNPTPTTRGTSTGGGTNLNGGGGGGAFGAAALLVLLSVSWRRHRRLQAA